MGTGFAWMASACRYLGPRPQGAPGPGRSLKTVLELDRFEQEGIGETGHAPSPDLVLLLRLDRTNET